MYQMISPLNKGSISEGSTRFTYSFTSQYSNCNALFSFHTFATGLIQRVIAQSGTALSFWSIDRTPAESAKLIARRLGCPTLIRTMMVNCMRKLSWQKIVKVQTDFASESFQNFTYASAGLTPVVEVNAPGAFISEEPEVILKYGDIPDIPVLIGANKHDGSYILATMFLAKIGPENLHKDSQYLREKIVQDLLRFVNIHEDPANRVVASSVELAYLHGVNRSSWNEIMPGLVDVLLPRLLVYTSLS